MLVSPPLERRLLMSVSRSGGTFNCMAQDLEMASTYCRDAINALNSKRFHQSSIKPPKMSLNTPKPPKCKFLTMLRITFGGLGSFELKAIRNRQVASSTLALGSRICRSSPIYEEGNSDPSQTVRWR
jgi:hypothetical protein